MPLSEGAARLVGGWLVMTMRRRGWRVAALALALALALAACDSGGSGASRGRGTGPASTVGGGGSAPNATSAARGGRCPLGPLPAPPADRPRYRMRITLQPRERLVGGDLRVRFTPDLATDRLVFRLWPNSPYLARIGAHLRAGPVDAGGRPLRSASPSPTVLEVRPGRELPAGQAIEVHLPWRLTLPGLLGERLGNLGGTMRLGSFFPLLAWEPGVGWATEPPTSGLAEASTSPTADFDVTVTAPRGLEVLASGVERGGGHWMASAVRDFALSAGHFRTASRVARAPDPVRVTVGVDASVQNERATDYLSSAVRALEDYAGRFSPYPWPSLTLAVTPGLPGGIEYPTHIMLGPGTANEITRHEVGHMWFYSLVGNDQARDPWLDEGLATYAEARVDGVTARYQRYAVPERARGRLGEPMTFWDAQPWSLYFSGVYAQGAKALLALGGPKVADCVLRVYAARKAYGIARPADMVQAASAVVPDAPRILAGFGVRQR
jgi:hypothetical protein